MVAAIQTLIKCSGIAGSISRSQTCQFVNFVFLGMAYVGIDSPRTHFLVNKHITISVLQTITFDLSTCNFPYFESLNYH